jgi:hypothetical protein
MLSYMVVTAVCACSWEIPNLHLELPVRRSITALFNLCLPSHPSCSCGPKCLGEAVSSSCALKLLMLCTTSRISYWITRKGMHIEPPSASSCFLTAHFCVALPSAGVLFWIVRCCLNIDMLFQNTWRYISIRAVSVY